jgi:hypothetical protein
MLSGQGENRPPRPLTSAPRASSAIAIGESEDREPTRGKTRLVAWVVGQFE